MERRARRFREIEVYHSKISRKTATLMGWPAFVRLEFGFAILVSVQLVSRGHNSYIYALQPIFAHGWGGGFFGNVDKSSGRLILCSLPIRSSFNNIRPPQGSPQSGRRSLFGFRGFAPRCVLTIFMNSMNFQNPVMLSARYCRIYRLE